MNRSMYKRISFFSFIFISLNIQSASGTLDTTYGSNGTGIVTIAIGRANTLNAIAAQTDNSLVGVGSVTVTMTDSGISRFTTNGALNTSFTSTGYAPLSIATKTMFQTVAIQSNTDAVIAGYAGAREVNFALARYTMLGALDTTFGGGNGYVTTNIGSGGNINALLIQSDGKIVAGGVAVQGSSQFALARYNTDGSLDTTFGTGGIVLTYMQYVSSINGLALQIDGKILAAGLAWNGAVNECALARYNTDGSLDTTFGNQGIVITAPGMWSQNQAVAVQTDGNIVVGGSTTNDGIHYSFVLMRYTTSGVLDTSFNGNGMVITQMNYSATLNTLAIQSDGKILAGGSNFGARTTNFALARYLSTGVLDTTFGTNGIALTTVGSSAQINSIIIQSDSKIVVAGTSDDSAVLARYLP